MKRFEICNCITAFEQKIKEREESFGRKVEKVGVENVALLLSSDTQGTTISIPIEVVILNGKRVKKEKVNGMAKFCPFCGKPMFKEVHDKQEGDNVES